MSATVSPESIPAQALHPEPSRESTAKTEEKNKPNPWLIFWDHEQPQRAQNTGTEMPRVYPYAGPVDR